MQRDQALQILNIESSTPALDDVMKARLRIFILICVNACILPQQYERYFKANDPKAGGSLYIQSKVKVAKETLEADFKEEAKKDAPPSSE